MRVSGRPCGNHAAAHIADAALFCAYALAPCTQRITQLDLVFNFHRAYFLLDELLLAGHQQETNKRVVASTVAKADELVELAESDPQSAEHLMRNTA